MTPATLLDERATWAGAHALPIFLALLVLLLAIWAVGRVLRQTGAGRSPRWPRAWPPGAARLLASGTVVALGSVTLVELAEQLRHGVSLVRLDMALNAALHASLPAPARRAFGALTHLGDTATLTSSPRADAGLHWDGWWRWRAMAC